MRNSLSRLSGGGSALKSFAGMSSIYVLGLNDIPVEEMKRRYETTEDKYIDYGGMQVRYRDEGIKTGPVLVLLHVVCSFLETWDGWIPYLKGHYRVLRMDMHGFGITGAASNKTQYGIEHSKQCINEFLTTMNVENCAMAGNSPGAYMTWNCAIEHPEKVSTIILIDPIGYNQKLPWLLMLAGHPVMCPITRHILPRLFLDMAVKEVYGGKSKATPEVKKTSYDFATRKGNKSSYVDIFT